MILFMLILVYVPLFFTSSAVAEESWDGPDNGKPICMFPKAKVGDPPNGCVYEYNYTDTNVKDNILVFNDQGALQDLYYDSEMSLCDNINSVSSDAEFVEIDISITATGAYRLNETNSYYSPNDDDFTVNLGQYRDFQIKY